MSYSLNICGCKRCVSDSCLSSASCISDSGGRLSAEIQWGEDIRINQWKEQRYKYTTKPEGRKTAAKNKRKKIKTVKSVILCDNQKRFVQVVQVNKIIDRRTLNRKEHLNLLCQPRNAPIDTVEVIRKKQTTIGPPRYHTLAIPKATRMLINWKEYYHHYCPDNINTLKKLLQWKDALTTQEANKYFGTLANQRRKKLKQKKQIKRRKICCKDADVKKDIDTVVNAVTKYFFKKPLCQVKDRHIVLTNEIINSVVDKDLASHLKRSNKDVCSTMLYETIDQISVWIDEKIDEIDTVDLEVKEGTLSLSTSATDTDATISDALFSEAGVRPKETKNEEISFSEQEETSSREEEEDDEEEEGYITTEEEEENERIIYEEEEERVINEKEEEEVIEKVDNEEKRRIGEEEEKVSKIKDKKEKEKNIKKEKKEKTIKEEKKQIKEKEQDKIIIFEEEQKEDVKIIQVENEDEEIIQKKYDEVKIIKEEEEMEIIKEDEEIKNEKDEEEEKTLIIEEEEQEEATIKEEYEQEISIKEEGEEEDTSMIEQEEEEGASMIEEEEEGASMIEEEKEELSIREEVEEELSIKDEEEEKTSKVEEEKDKIIAREEVQDETNIINEDEGKIIEKEESKPKEDEIFTKKKPEKINIIDEEEKTIIVEDEKRKEEDVKEIEVEKLEEVEDKEENMIDKEKEVEKEIEKQEDKEVIEEKEKEAEEEEQIKGDEKEEEQIKGDEKEEEQIKGDEKEEEEIEESPEYKSEEFEKETPIKKYREHSVDLVCCRTLKLWADWLMEVARNTHKWGIWIQNVIAQVRLFACILKGEIDNPDGSTRILYREEWEAFKIQLEHDINEFNRYSEHVSLLSERLIAQFMNKDVACCPICMESKLILGLDQTHSVISTLAVAINTSEYWRNWLGDLVEQARQVTALSLGNLDAMPCDLSLDSGSSSIDASSYELLEISNKPCSCGNLYVLEERCRRT